MRRSPDQHRSGHIGRRYHLLALGLLAAVLALWTVVMTVATRDADLAPDRFRLVTAVFPFDTGIKDVYLATGEAGGSIVADTWLPNVWVLHSDEPGYAGRLRGAGAIVVVDVALFQQMTIPNCGGV